VTCRCHSGPLYASLYDCPSCGHHSLEALETWAGCERKACGWQTTSRRSYRLLSRWPAYGLFKAGELVASIRAPDAIEARVLFIGNYGTGAGDRVRRIS
jgi:hypothetical protein